MRRDRGVAILVVLMLIAGLLIVGQMAMLVLDQVTQRSGTFRRLEQGQYCVEEGLNLGRAWVTQNASLSGSINPIILTGAPLKGTGLFADPANPNDFKWALNKDLCELSSTAATTYVGGPPFFGLQGICRTIPASDPNANWCGAAPLCPMYRINLVDDIDEPPPAVDPYTDENQAFFIRAECMAKDVGTTAVTGANPALDQVAFVEVNEAGGGNCYGPGGANHAGCGGGPAN